MKTVPASRAKTVFFLTFGPIALLFLIFLVAVTVTNSADRLTFLVIELPYLAIIIFLIVRAIYGLDLVMTDEVLIYRTMFRTKKFKRESIEKAELLDGTSGLANVTTPIISIAGQQSIRLRIFNQPKSKVPSASQQKGMSALAELVDSLNEWSMGARTTPDEENSSS